MQFHPNRVTSGEDRNKLRGRFPPNLAAFVGICTPAMQKYPPYAHLIELHPSREAFDNAWRVLFGFFPSDCRVTFSSNNPRSGAVIRPPDGKLIIHGGFIPHTDTPDLEPGSCFHYFGRGPTWDIDRSGVRYHLIDPKTNLPPEFREVEAEIIVFRFLNDVAAREGAGHQPINFLTSKA